MEAFRDLPPGTKVPSERELTKDLGVGRSTVREALNGLAVLGVLTIRHGQGAFIADARRTRGSDCRRRAARPDHGARARGHPRVHRSHACWWR